MKHLVQILFILALQLNLKAQTTHFVEVSGMTFTPAVLLIEPGDAVEWTNTSGLHNINGTQATYPTNAEDFTSGAPAVAPWTYTHTFTETGLNLYMCDIHGPAMSGAITVNTPLPVELRSISTIVSNSLCTVNWQTDREENISHYILQRSLNGIDFADLTAIDANNLPSVYQFTDNMGIAPRIYYRLEMVDIDQSVKFSPIRMALNDKKYSYYTLALSPNPFTDQFKIIVPSETNWTGLVEIYSMTGALMMRKQYSFSEGNNQVDLNVSNGLPAGLYVVAVRDQHNHREILSSTVLKQ